MSNSLGGLKPLNFALLTVSDTRQIEDDTSGAFLLDVMQTTGHDLVERDLLKDNLYEVRAKVACWIADEEIQVVLITGGTGFSKRDVTPEAVLPLLDKEIPGFGELFRCLSIAEVGSSTLQSRAFGGLSNNTLIFALPGSTNACRTAWEGILLEQLDSSHKPCNFVGLVD